VHQKRAIGNAGSSKQRGEEEGEILLIKPGKEKKEEGGGEFLRLKKWVILAKDPRPRRNERRGKRKAQYPGITIMTIEERGKEGETCCAWPV